MVDTSGLEPPTPTMSRWCSNQTELRVYNISILHKVVFKNSHFFNKLEIIV